MLGHVVNDGSVYIFAALIPYYTQTLGMSYVEAGFAWTLLNLAGSLPQPFLGMIADRLKDYSLAGIGLIICVIALGPVGFVSNYAVILVLATIAGIGTALVHPVGASFTAAASGKYRGLAMSLFTLGGNIGFALAPLLLAPAILLAGPRVSAAIVPVGLLVAVPLFLVSSKVKQEKPPEPRRDASGKPHSAPVFAMFLLVMVALFRMWVYTASVTFMPTFLATRGFDLNTSAQLLSVMLVMGAAGSLLGGAMFDRCSPKWATILSHAAATVLLGVFFTTSGPVSIVALALAGFFLLWSMAVTIVMAQKLLPNSQSLASGLMIGLGIGLGGIGVSITGWMTDVFGIVVAMTSLTVVAFLATVMLLPYRERRVNAVPEAQASAAGA